MIMPKLWQRSPGRSPKREVARRATTVTLSADDLVGPRRAPGCWPGAPLRARPQGAGPRPPQGGDDPPRGARPDRALTSPTTPRVGCAGSGRGRQHLRPSMSLPSSWITPCVFD